MEVNSVDRVESYVHRTKGDQVMLEVAFHGGHWRFDGEIRKAVADAIRTTTPAAVLVDLSEFRYRGGDYASGFMEAFLDRAHGGVRPACFVAASRGVKTLFNVIDHMGAFAVRYFDCRTEALDYLRARLEPTG